MKAVLEEVEGEYQLISTDCLHDFTPLDITKLENLSSVYNPSVMRNFSSSVMAINRTISRNSDNQEDCFVPPNDYSGSVMANDSEAISGIASGEENFTDKDLTGNTPRNNGFGVMMIDRTTSPNSDNQEDCFVPPNDGFGVMTIDRTTSPNSDNQEDCFVPSNDDRTSLLSPPTSEQQNTIEKWLKVKVQFPLKQEESQKRQRELKIRQDYLEQAMNSAIKEARSAYLKLASKVAKGDDTFRIARDNAQNKINLLQERYNNKKNQLSYLQLVRPDKIRYFGTALVIPTPHINNMRTDEEVEAIAIEYVMNYERERGWIPTDVSQLRDGCSFDIRSVKDGEDDSNNVLVRRIEVKGRADFNQDVCLTNNEWRRAQQLGDSYWLYVVWGCKTNALQLITIQNPVVALAGNVKEIKQVTRYIIGGSTLAQYHHD
ncbi:DUF3883 domain-containing protein [Geminocystis sp.]|uniref:DUF3883 domain-containing protein n=1 Tax=Geminocystis sp. TaxID=2664100 RepID=UPI003593F96D